MSRPLEETIGKIAAQGYALTIDLTIRGWAITATNPNPARSQFTPAQIRPSGGGTEALVHDVEVMLGLVLLAEVSPASRRCD